MMPTKREVEKRAKELYLEDQRDFFITPTDRELKEDGYEHEARNELMRNQEKHEVLSYLERMANENGYTLVRAKSNELKKQIKPFDFEIDVKEALRSGVFICGGKGTTKTNLAKIISDKFLKLGYTVKAFDISQAWLKSSIPSCMLIKPRDTFKIKLYESMVFDLSLLIPRDVKRFITHVLANEWKLQVNTPESERRNIIYVFEEVQVLIPQGQLRSNEAQVVLRLLTTGRNYKLGYVAITQRPALTDTSVFELSFQKYFARLDGANDKRKAACYIGVKAYGLEKLKLGEFIYDKANESKWIRTYEFKPKSKPMLVIA